MAESTGVNAQRRWQTDNICLSCHWYNISISSGPGGSLPDINRPKTTMGSHSKHQPLTFAQHPQRRGKSTNVPALWEHWESVSLFLRLCSSSVSFFSLSGQPFSWRTLKVVWHTWFVAGDSRGIKGAGRSRRSKTARRRQLNGGILFRQSPSSPVITAIRGFQVQLQAHLFLRLCAGFVCVYTCVCVCVFVKRSSWVNVV